MNISRQNRNPKKPARNTFHGLAIALAIALLLACGGVQTIEAQTFTVLHAFTGGTDGANPFAGVTFDRGGKLYGTTSIGYGSVFKLVSSGSGWVLTPVWNFTATIANGAIPYSKVVFGPDGAVYGTTYEGGQGGCFDGGGCGTVFKLQPPATACRSAMCPWTETVIYRFTGGADGGNPYSEVVFDSAGNLYGTTTAGGLNSGGCDHGCGVVYEMTLSGGTWTETTLHLFRGGNDGQEPEGGLIFDHAGNLYGTTASGGSLSAGIVFELSPNGNGWRETILHTFQGSDGAVPFATMTADQAGNLYGTTVAGGTTNGGTVFELTNPGTWNYNLLHSFNDDLPYGGLAFDSAGNLYGTTYQGGTYGNGTVFKMTPSGGGWSESVIHSFNPADGEGALPMSGVTFDGAGNMYGTTFGGGSFGGSCYGGCGVVYEITP